MNRMQQQMMAMDPMAAQQEQMAYYHPAQISQGGQGGQMGMSLDQMGSAIMQRKMRDAQQAQSLVQAGAAF